MEVRLKRLSDRGIELKVRGRLDAETVGELRPMLLDTLLPSPRVLLNLSEVNAIDAAGMALLMMARVELEATGTRFVVQSTNTSVTRTMVAAGMPRFVDLAPRRLDALRALGEEVRPEEVRRTFAPKRSRRKRFMATGEKTQTRSARL